jgi:hypothetical protein
MFLFSWLRQYRRFGAATLLEMHMEIFAVVGKFPKNKCVVSFQARKKRFIKCMGILPLTSCNKTKGKHFHEKKDIYGKFIGKYISVGKFPAYTEIFHAYTEIFLG